MYDTWGLVAEKPKGSWRPFTKHTRTNCAPAEFATAASPLAAPGTKFQKAAFIHKTLEERKKAARVEKRARINSALASKSRAQVERDVDESTRVISQLTRGSRPSQGSIPEDEEAEQWFDE